MKKAQNVLNFYLLTSTLKTKIRQGLINWNISAERLESVAEHVYGVCMFAIAIDSEYDFDIDLNKVILMLTIHELEEIIIGDITPYEKVSAKEKLTKGHLAISIILKDLIKKEKYEQLINEFDEKETKDKNTHSLSGYGIHNVRERLRLQYGEQFVLSIESKKNQGTKVFIRIPKITNQG